MLQAALNASTGATYDLGEHTLTIEDETITLADKVGTDTTMQEIRLDSEELYKLLITLQALFA